MTISIDSNIFVGLWDKDESINLPAKKVLRHLSSTHKLVVSGVVFAELLGGPEREASQLREFFQKARITIEWPLGKKYFYWLGRVIKDTACADERGAAGCRSVSSPIS